MSLTKKRRQPGMQLRLMSMEPTFPSTTSTRFLRRRSPCRHFVVFAVFVGLFVGLWFLVEPNKVQLVVRLEPVPVPSPGPSPPFRTPSPPIPAGTEEELEEEEPPRPIELERAKNIDLWWWLTNETPATWFLDVIPALREAPPPSTFTCQASPEFGPLLLIAVFSTAKGWEKRHIIRLLGRQGLGPDVQSEVQFRFVVGKSKDAAAEEALAQEAARHQDIIQLDFPENMDEGKTYQFFKWVGERPMGERPQFALKTDDDTFLVLPNLVRSFASLNCSEPIYYGTSWGSCIENCYPFYMRGMAYGLSWPLIRWLAVADLPLEDARQTEDARTGSWFLSLPPGEPIKVVDLHRRLGDYDGDRLPINSGTVALHAMKSNWLWVEIGVKLMNAWKDEGKEYIFTRIAPPPPPSNVTNSTA